MCLKDYVGIKGCTPVPLSGKYINQLPGMSTELIDNIASKDQITYVGVWNDIQDMSYMQFKSDVANYILTDRNYEYQETFYQTRKIAKYTNDLILEGSNYRGIHVKMPDSKYSELFVKSIQLISKNEISSKIIIIDLNNNSKIDEIEVDLIIGLNEISIDKKYFSKFQTLNFFIGIQENFETVEVKPEYYFMDSDCECSHHFNQDNEYRYYPAIFDLTNGFLDETGAGQGFALDAEINCSLDAYICDFKEKFLTAWMHILAYQTLFYKIGSPRVNMFTTSNLQQTIFLRDEFISTYKKEIRKAVRSIPLDNLCAMCDQNTANISYGGSVA